MKADNAHRMTINPPSTRLVPADGPRRVYDDGSTWRAENGHRAMERAAINGRG